MPLLRKGPRSGPFAQPRTTTALACFYSATPAWNSTAVDNDPSPLKWGDYPGTKHLIDFQLASDVARHRVNVPTLILLLRLQCVRGSYPPLRQVGSERWEAAPVNPFASVNMA